MRYRYVVILKKDGERATDLLSILLCLGTAVIFLRTLFNPHPNYYQPAFSVILFGGLLYNVFVRRRQGKQVRYKYLLLAAALGWFGMSDFPWIGLVFVALAFLEHQTKRPLEIGFDRDRVVINTLIRRRHSWSAFNNVLLKDGLLTLDFKNNRLLQKEIIDDDDEDNADEEEFNAYCRDRLESTPLSVPPPTD